MKVIQTSHVGFIVIIQRRNTIVPIHSWYTQFVHFEWNINQNVSWWGTRLEEWQRKGMDRKWQKGQVGGDIARECEKEASPRHFSRSTPLVSLSLDDGCDVLQNWIQERDIFHPFWRQDCCTCPVQARQLMLEISCLLYCSSPGNGSGAFNHQNLFPRYGVWSIRPLLIK